ncbi:hypothetical protein T439DRAFT_376701 [Meredithblackwellia eburnea MCA 4105]
MSKSRQVAVDNTSVRAKSKVVFKPVLDNPHSVQWPAPSSSVRKELLEALVTFLQTPAEIGDLPIAEWRTKEHARRRGRTHGAGKDKGVERGKDKQKESAKSRRADQVVGSSKKGERARLEEGERPSKRTRIDSSIPIETRPVTLRSTKVVNIPTKTDPSSKDPKPIPPCTPRPRILDHLSIGINEVTRALESRIRWGRWELGDQSAAPSTCQTSDSGLTTSKQSSQARRKPKRPTMRNLDPLKPTSIVTHQRPSWRFLTYVAPKPTSTVLPPYLLPPSQTSPFFRMLLNSRQKELNAKKVKDRPLMKELLRTSKAQGRADLLLDVIKEDRVKELRDLGMARNTKLNKRKKLARKWVKEGKTASLENEGTKDEDGIAMDEDGQGASELEHNDGTGDTQEEGLEEEEEEDPSKLVPMIDLIFVCKPDINPPSLVDHLTTMSAAANGVNDALSIRIQHEKEHVGTEMDVERPNKTVPSPIQRPLPHSVLLIPLDMGAELLLSDILGIRRVAAVGVSSLAPNAVPLLEVVKRHITPLQAPWLVPQLLHPSIPQVPHQLIPTHIKHLRTTGPVDTRAANAESKVRRKAQKERARKRKRGEAEMEPVETHGVYVAED